MASKRMNLSGEGKEILDRLCDVLELDRPLAIHIAFSKGISNANGPVQVDTNKEQEKQKEKWTIPDGIIKDKEYLLFKHLILNEIKKPLNEDEIDKYLLQYIEHGLKEIKEDIDHLASLEDYRITIIKD